MIIQTGQTWGAMVMSKPGKRKPGVPPPVKAKREVTYKHHVIRYSSYRLLAGGWVPQSEIITTIPEGIRETLLTDKTSYPTQEEADAAALALAKRWINSN